MQHVSAWRIQKTFGELLMKANRGLAVASPVIDGDLNPCPATIAVRSQPLRQLHGDAPAKSWFFDFFNYSVNAEGNYGVRVELRDRDSALAAGESENRELTLENPRLWQVRNAYPYTLTILLKKGNQTVDRYGAKVGIRTISI